MSAHTPQSPTIAKTPFDAITMRHMDVGDMGLKWHIPHLAVQQASAHDVTFNDYTVHHSQRNFADIVGRKGVDIWMIKEPKYGAGAIFTSVLKHDGKIGLQGEDAVVDEKYRGHGFGSALVCFRARLAKENGYSFVGWECEDGDTPSINQRHAVFTTLGGHKRDGMKPFRLGRSVIDGIDDAPTDIIQSIKTETLYQSMQVKEYTWDGGSATVSPRFSLFRTLGRGSVADDTGYNQTSSGIQIEDLVFNDAAKAHDAVKAILKNEDADARRCAFADVVVDVTKPELMELVSSFDAEQNTYSGNPSFLWVLEGDAFERAALRARDLKIDG